MQYDLIFEGGGAKGTVFVGALQEFAARGHSARRFAGTSAGAITATLMAAGYSPDDMLEAVNERVDGKPRFSTFMDVPRDFPDKAVEKSLTYSVFKKVDIPLVPNWLEDKIDKKIFAQLLKFRAYRQSFSFVELGGLYAGDKFVEWLDEKLGRANLAETTFAEFFQQTGNDLSVVIADTTSHLRRVLNHRTAPACPVKWGVRMSMSIPFVWQEVHWRKEWGPYLDEPIAGHTIVDGGTLSNFPIDLFTSRDANVVRIMGDTDPDAVPNLGFVIDESQPVEGAEPPADEDEGDDDGLLEDIEHLRTTRRVKRLVDTMTGARDLGLIQTYNDEVCRLPAKGYGTTEFDMSPQRTQALINAGRQAAKTYFEGQPA
jgi:NTE family protein